MYSCFCKQGDFFKPSKRVESLFYFPSCFQKSVSGSGIIDTCYFVLDYSKSYLKGNRILKIISRECGKIKQ